MRGCDRFGNLNAREGKSRCALPPNESATLCSLIARLDSSEVLVDLATKSSYVVGMWKKGSEEDLEDSGKPMMILWYLLGEEGEEE